MSARAMTVADLTRFLQQYPKDMPVFITGYEGGCWSLTAGFIEETYIEFDEFKECQGYFGPHGQTCNKPTDKGEDEFAQGIIISHTPPHTEREDHD